MTESIHTRGAVDLGALAKAREAQQKAAAAAQSGGAGLGSIIIDVTEADFQVEVLERSLSVPVIVIMWADWSDQSTTLSPILESHAAQDAGRWILAKIDTEAQPRLAQAFQVQSVPSVFAVIQGQVLPLFQGPVPASQIRQLVDAVLHQAEQLGVTGTVSGAAPDQPAAGEPEPEPIDPDLDAAYTAMETADWPGAEAAFKRLLAKNPSDENAKVGMATSGLYSRVMGADFDAVMAQAAAGPSDVAVQSLAADLEIANGDADAAFKRLIDCVRATREEDRAAARTHLLALFEVVGSGDPRVAKARIALANALF